MLKLTDKSLTRSEQASASITPALSSSPTLTLAVGENSYSLYAPVILSDNPSNLVAFHRNGQTFITWSEQDSLQGERYRIYRSMNPITPGNLSQAMLIAELPKNSASFYANRYHDIQSDIWYPRYSDRLIIQDNGVPLPQGTGLFVWTVSADGLGENKSGSAYYAITVKPKNGAEIVNELSAIGPIKEEVGDPLPVEITLSSGVNPGPGGHVYIQFMDFRNWNPTFHAPNPNNSYYGMNPTDPSLDGAVQYAYDYTVYAPTPDFCSGSLPDKLPVFVSLHGWRENRYKAPHNNPYSYCAYGIYPIDTSETWYFGFARDHDYRKADNFVSGDAIENYTEQRILRMIYDLIRNPPGPTVDIQKVYVFGHSMGGSGALAFAERYANVFAASYSSQPVTNYRTAGLSGAMDPALIWGPPELNLPVLISGPGDWAAHLERYDGIGVWDWQNYQESLPGGNKYRRAIDDMVPLGIDLGIPDHVIKWDTQGKPIYAQLNASHQAWGGAATNQDHNDAWVLSDIGFPASLKSQQVPFWNLSIIKDETVPGMSNLSSNSSYLPQSEAIFNQTLKWSSSWDPWDGPPVDTPNRWQMSFCSVAIHSRDCGTGGDQTVDITPRRVHHFIIKPNTYYDWEARRITGNKLIASGTILADQDGLIIIAKFPVLSTGSRLIVRPHTNP